ncbi:MAG: rod-binding protein [Bacteriovoracaceae bacterium]|nr:rod-binding protein [Bacteriovoracaceae bacterium]
MIEIKNSHQPVPISQNRSKNVKSDLQYIPDEYREVARNLEGEFAKYMVDQMNKTVERNHDNTTNKIYRDLLDTERANMMTKTNNGLGLQKIILDQIYPKRLRNKLSHQIYQQHMKSQNQRFHRSKQPEMLSNPNTAISTKETSNE